MEEGCGEGERSPPGRDAPREEGCARMIAVFLKASVVATERAMGEGCQAGAPTRCRAGGKRSSKKERREYGLNNLSEVPQNRTKRGEVGERKEKDTDAKRVSTVIKLS